ncbi:tetratricopeptide repeat protein [Kocuria rosea]|uniref:Tetratricopeptide repeat protein n=1 Tax=Kocuria rosea TaxID=1275 RepID=A0A4R5YBH0_KOCRO|nr:tetratricopeptide repeat protein [Kocuria rosea]TDL42043.1 tetratricopeptide repeat protein [Kocuria rosea]
MNEFQHQQPRRTAETAPPPQEAPLPSSVRGSVDLGAVPAAGPGGPPAGEGRPGGYRREVTAADFQEVAELSTRVPVVFALWARFSEQSVAFTDTLEQVVDRYRGRLLLASVDAEAAPEIAQMFQAQSVPTVVALLGGRPVPLFNSTVPAEQVTQLLDELLALAEQNGITGTVEPVRPDDEPEPLPPLHQEAVDALEAGDVDAAEAAYRRAIAENPGDREAKLALAQVHLLQRVLPLDAATVRAEAAAAPEDVAAQLAVADLDVSGGHMEDAFRRLLDLVRRTAGEERDTVRLRLLELFDVVGAEDPRTVTARGALMRALF